VLFTALIAAVLLAAIALLPTRSQAADVEASPPIERSVTVYRGPYADEGLHLENLGGFALVTETRTVVLPAGDSRLRFPGVADGIESQSALLTGLPDGVLEKNRDARVLSPGALVAATLGAPVTLVRTHRRTGRITRLSGTLRASGGGVVFESSEGVEALRCSGLPEMFTFIGTADLTPTPTLSVKVRTPEALSATVTLSYLAQGFDWSATYIATLSEDAHTLDLGAWVTLANSNGVAFPDARTSVVAGRLNRENGEVEPLSSGERVVAQCWPTGTTRDIPDEIDERLVARRLAARRRIGAGRGDIVANTPLTVVVEEEQLGDLKLYRVPERTSISARQMKQVRLLDRDAVPVELLHIALLAVGQETQLAARRVLRTRNDGEHHLGLPLPSGTVSTFTGEADTPLLLGEGPLRDIAVGEDFEIAAGEAADVQVRAINERILAARSVRQIPLIPGVLAIRTRTQTQVSRIEITNARRTDITFEVRLRLPADWQVVRSTVAPLLRDGRQVMRVEVPAAGEVTIRYQTVQQLPRRARRG
jgi:hypothetical protein